MTDNLFHIIDDTFVILRSRGVYKQCKVYVRRDRVYAGFAGGFVRLGGHGFTSAPNVSYEDLDADEFGKGADGAPIYRPLKERK